MKSSVDELIKENRGRNFELQEKYLNPQFSKVLKTIHFDRCFEKASGPYLYDIDGNRFTDFLSGYGVFALGRNNPDVVKSIKEAMDLSLSTLVQMEASLTAGLLAEKLITLSPFETLTKVFLTNSGTEAVEGAIKFARAATSKERILCFDHAFHGLSTGSLSLNGSEEFKKGFGVLLPSNVIPLNDEQALENELKKGDVAAVIMEPIQGKGVYVPKPSFMKRVNELAHQYKSLFIIDEIQAGLYRTGTFLASEHEGNLSPDIVLLSKALSGGMIPIGAILYTDFIYKKVFSSMDRCVVHSSTFSQNTLAAIAGLTILDLLREEKIQNHLKEITTYLWEELKKLENYSDWIKEIRGRGLMVGIELGKPKGLRSKLTWNMVNKLEKGLFAQLVVIPLFKDHQIITQVSGHHQDVIKILPPFIINKQDVDHFITSIKLVLDSLHKVGSPLWDLSKNILKQSIAAKKS